MSVIGLPDVSTILTTHKLLYLPQSHLCSRSLYFHDKAQQDFAHPSIHQKLTKTCYSVVHFRGCGIYRWKSS